MGRWLAEFKKEPHEQAAFGKKPKKVIDFDTKARKVRKVLAKHGIAPIRSSTLDGEIIYFARDQAAAGKASKGAVVYTLDELRVLAKNPPNKEELLKLHTSKKVLGGEVVNPEREIGGKTPDR